MARLVQLLLLAVCFIAIKCSVHFIHQMHHLHRMHHMMHYPHHMMHHNLGMMYMYPGMMGFKEADELEPNDGAIPDGMISSDLLEGVSPDKLNPATGGRVDGQVPKGPWEVTDASGAVADHIRDSHLDEKKGGIPVGGV